MNTLRINYSLKAEEKNIFCSIDLQVKDTYENFIKQRSMQLDYVLNILAKVQGYELDRILKVEEIKNIAAVFPWEDFRNKKITVKVIGEENTKEFLREAETRKFYWSKHKKATDNSLVMYYARENIPFWIICDGDMAELVVTTNPLNHNEFRTKKEITWEGNK